MHRNLFAPVILLVSLALVLGACTAGGTTQAPTTPVPAPAGASGTGVTVKAESPVLVESARTLPAVLAEKDAWFAALSPNGAYHRLLHRDRARQGSDFADLHLHLRWRRQEVPQSAGRSLEGLSLPAPMVAGQHHGCLHGEPGGVRQRCRHLGSQGSRTVRSPTSPMTAWWARGASPPAPLLPRWTTCPCGAGPTARSTSGGSSRRANTRYSPSGIYRIAPGGGAPELVRDVTAALPKSTVLFKQEEFFLDGPSALSPDGKSVAALLSTADEMGAVSTGLWQINLADAAAAPRKLMDPAAFNAAQPAWAQYPAIPMGVAWTSDGKGVVVLAKSKDEHTPFTLFYHVDTGSGQGDAGGGFQGRGRSRSIL